MPTRWNRFLVGFAAPAAVAAALALTAVDVGLPASLVVGAVVGLLGWCAVAVHDASRSGRPVPLVAVAGLLAPVAVVAAGVGVWVGIAGSRAAGTWILWAALLAGVCLVLDALVGASARLRAWAVGLCVAAVALPVVATVAFGIVAMRTDERVAAVVADFPAPGPAVDTTPEDLRRVDSEVFLHDVRTLDTDLTCTELRDLVEEWADRPGRLVDRDTEDCLVESRTAWTVRRALLRGDGTVMVTAWSPVMPLFFLD